MQERPQTRGVVLGVAILSLRPRGHLTDPRTPLGPRQVPRGAARYPETWTRPLFLSVPALSIPHMTPFHFRAYTPIGLAVELENAGFQVLELGAGERTTPPRCSPGSAGQLTRSSVNPRSTTPMSHASMPSHGAPLIRIAGNSALAYAPAGFFHAPFRQVQPAVTTYSHPQLPSSPSKWPISLCNSKFP